MDECRYFTKTVDMDLFSARGCLHQLEDDRCYHPLCGHVYKPCPYYKVNVEPRADSDDDGEVE